MNAKDILNSSPVYVDLTSIDANRNDYELALCEELFAIVLIHLNNTGTQFAVVSLDEIYSPFEDLEASIEAMVFSSVEDALDYVDTLASTWYKAFADSDNTRKPDDEQLNHLLDRHAGVFPAQQILETIFNQIQVSEVVSKSH
jgi:hypothetical protein